MYRVAIVEIDVNVIFKTSISYVAVSLICSKLFFLVSYYYAFNLNIILIKHNSTIQEKNFDL
jgi:hypothetical protein